MTKIVNYGRYGTDSLYEWKKNGKEWIFRKNKSLSIEFWALNIFIGLYELYSKSCEMNKTKFHLAIICNPHLAFQRVHEQEQ